MYLFKLPLELLDELFMHFIQVRSFKRAMRLRLVSKAFKQYVDKAIFRSRILDEIIQPYELHPVDTWCNAGWASYVQHYLSHRIVLESDPALPGIRIRRVGEEICVLTGEQGNTALLDCIRRLCGLAFFDGVPRLRALILSTPGAEPDEYQLKQDLIDAAVYLDLVPLVSELLTDNSRHESVTFYEAQRLLDNRLEVAAFNGNLKMVKLLLASEPSVVPQGGTLSARFIYSVLRFAAIGGHQNVFDFGLDCCEAGLNSPSRTEYFLDNAGLEQALLLTAFPVNYIRGASLLDGANLDHHKSASLDDQLSRLDTSARWGRIEMVRYLLGQGVCPNYPTSHKDYDGPLDDHVEVKKPLLSAVKSRKEEIVRMMLDAGGDPDWYGPEETPLMAGVHGGSMEIVRVLVERGADVNTGSPPPIALAVRSENMDIFRYLREQGAILSLPDSGAWAMAFAQFDGLDSMIDVLVQAGVGEKEVLHRVPPAREVYAERYVFKRSDYAIIT